MGGIKILNFIRFIHDLVHSSEVPNRFVLYLQLLFFLIIVKRLLLRVLAKFCELTGIVRLNSIWILIRDQLLVLLNANIASNTSIWVMLKVVIKISSEEFLCV